MGGNLQDSGQNQNAPVTRCESDRWDCFPFGGRSSPRAVGNTAVETENLAGRESHADIRDEE
jgi:hypothetical protein